MADSSAYVHLQPGENFVARFKHRGRGFVAAPWNRHDEDSAYGLITTAGDDDLVKYIRESGNSSLMARVICADLSHPFSKPMQEDYPAAYLMRQGMLSGVCEVLLFFDS